MQVTTSRTISQQVNTNLLQSDFSNITRSLGRKVHFTSLHPFVNFHGQISAGNFLFPIQKFSLKENGDFVFIENFPTGSFPKIEIVLEDKKTNFDVKKFKVYPSDRSVQGEVLYTRLFLLTAAAKKCSLRFRDIDFQLLNFSFSDLSPQEESQMLYRAKLFRKLRFLEEVFKTTFIVPECITANDAKQVEVLFRGLIEGEFTIPIDKSITVFNYEVKKSDLQNKSLPEKKSFTTEFNEDLLVLGKFFPIGKMIFSLDRASVANPRIVRNVKVGDVIPSLRLNVFDSQVRHRFEKYSQPERLLKNKQRLERFKNALHNEESDFLVSLVDEPLAEITATLAVEIVEGLLQYNDFPDRFSVMKPELVKNRWKVPIALTYPKLEPILLADAFVDVKTGKVKMKISFDELLKRGKKKAKEVFSIA